MLFSSGTEALQSCVRGRSRERTRSPNGKIGAAEISTGDALRESKRRILKRNAPAVFVDIMSSRTLPHQRNYVFFFLAYVLSFCCLQMQATSAFLFDPCPQASVEMTREKAVDTHKNGNVFASTSFTSATDLLRSTACQAASDSSDHSTSPASPSRGKLLVLGGTGFLGQEICHRAALDGYLVTSLSRRGLPAPLASQSSNSFAATSNRSASLNIDYRQGDARRRDAINSILREGGYNGVVHCIGLLLDEESGLGNLNRYASGSGSVPDADSTYDTITRVTAFNAIEAVSDYCKDLRTETSFPFCFISAAEAGWPDVSGGSIIENTLAPDFLRRYLSAKRSVESKLLDSKPTLRPVIFRPSLVYSTDRPASFLAVGAFVLGNAIGLPFVDHPVTVQSLATAVVRTMSRPLIKGIQRYQDIEELAAEQQV
jgi:nucleoside-diphosphate-sugar epimerase